jgi:hypothetical protein
MFHTSGKNLNRDRRRGLLWNMRKLAWTEGKLWVHNTFKFPKCGNRIRNRSFCIAFLPNWHHRRMLNDTDRRLEIRNALDIFVPIASAEDVFSYSCSEQVKKQVTNRTVACLCLLWWLGWTFGLQRTTELLFTWMHNRHRSVDHPALYALLSLA